jgi:hypothetical protein
MSAFSPKSEQTPQNCERSGVNVVLTAKFILNWLPDFYRLRALDTRLLKSPFRRIPSTTLLDLERRCRLFEWIFDWHVCGEIANVLCDKVEW